MSEKRGVKIVVLKWKWLLIVAACAVLFLGGFFLSKSNFQTEGKVTKLGFEDIGELATQTAICTSVRSDKNDRKLFGVTIPFTTSQAIYSYDVVVKAGINFSDVYWKENEAERKIIVTMPQAYVISNEIKLDSLKVLLEDESIFTPVKIENINNSFEELKKDASESAVANGLLEEAKDNAKTLLTAFFSKGFDMSIYSIEFVTSSAVQN